VCLVTFLENDWRESIHLQYSREICHSARDIRLLAWLLRRVLQQENTFWRVLTVFRRLLIAGAVGAATMYLMDAENGAQRRAQALDYIDMRLNDLSKLLNQTTNNTPTLAPYSSEGDMEPATMLNSQRANKRNSARSPKSLPSSITGSYTDSSTTSYTDSSTSSL